jgi:hypothetical protein
MRLFKYRRVNEYTRALLAENELFFPAAKQLNDPYDCAVRVIFSGGSRDQCHELVRIRLRKHVENFLLSEDKFIEVAD